MKKNKTKLKKGFYYIGDIGYIFDKTWNKILKETDFFKKENTKILGKNCFVNNTKFGDGVYEDEESREYGVDSGLIGCIPIELIDRDNVDNSKSFGCGLYNNYAHIFYMEKDFECKFIDGVFVFDKTKIDTSKNIFKGDV